MRCALKAANAAAGMNPGFACHFALPKGGPQSYARLWDDDGPGTASRTRPIFPKCRFFWLCRAYFFAFSALLLAITSSHVTVSAMRKVRNSSGDVPCASEPSALR